MKSATVVDGNLAFTSNQNAVLVVLYVLNLYLASKVGAGTLEVLLVLLNYEYKSTS